VSSLSWSRYVYPTHICLNGYSITIKLSLELKTSDVYIPASLLTSISFFSTFITVVVLLLRTLIYLCSGPTLMGILPYAGLKFYIYEGLKAHVPEDYKNSVTLKLSCGAAAGLFGQTLTYPLDVVRRQMQVQSQQYHDKFGGPQIRGTFQGLMIIKQTQGWRQLFAGLSLNYIKVVPSVAIGFTAYDTMKSLLKIPPREKKMSGHGSN
jgi:hypothetical protein